MTNEKQNLCISTYQMQMALSVLDCTIIEFAHEINISTTKLNYYAAAQTSLTEEDLLKCQRNFERHGIFFGSRHSVYLPTK